MPEEHNCVISTTKHISKLRYRVHGPKIDPPSSTFNKVSVTLFINDVLWILEEDFAK